MFYEKELKDLEQQRRVLAAESDLLRANIQVSAFQFRQFKTRLHSRVRDAASHLPAGGALAVIPAILGGVLLVKLGRLVPKLGRNMESGLSLARQALALFALFRARKETAKSSSVEGDRFA